jgi:hypothetical protein
MQGLVIFKNAAEAIAAGYIIQGPIPDREGFLHAKIRTESGSLYAWALALVKV